jgi:hypothetical protein
MAHIVDQVGIMEIGLVEEVQVVQDTVVVRTA